MTINGKLFPLNKQIFWDGVKLAIKLGLKPALIVFLCAGVFLMIIWFIKRFTKRGRI